MEDLMEQLLSESLVARRRIPEPQQVRPLTDLLNRPPPEDWYEQKTFEREIELAEKAFKAAHPLGLNRSELDVVLAVGDDFRLECAQKLCQNERLVRYLDAQYDIASRCGKDWVSSADATVLARWLEDNGHELHIWELSRFLSFAEIARLAHECRYSGTLSSEVYRHPYHMYVHKLALSAWHWYTPYGEPGSRFPWQKVVDFHKVFMGFELGLPGFEIHIDHSHYFCNMRGWGEYTGRTVDPVTGAVSGTWIDGELAFVVSYGGKHVMTIGVSTTYAGLLVNQVQLKQKKGNRWLYKLPEPYFEYVLKRLLKVCQEHGVALYLVTGDSLAKRIKELYKERVFSREAGQHIVQTYNQPFAQLQRVPVDLTVNQHKYCQITV